MRGFKLIKPKIEIAGFILEFNLGVRFTIRNLQYKQARKSYYEKKYSKIKVIFGENEGIKKKEVMWLAGNVSGDIEKQKLDKYVEHGWSLIYLPHWAHSSKTRLDLKKVLRKIARPRCFHLLDFGENPFWQPRQPVIAFRFRKHAAEFLTAWAEKQTEWKNIYETGYAEGSREKMIEKLREDWEGLHIVEIEKYIWSHETNKWLGEHNVQDYRVDEQYDYDKKQHIATWFFKNEEDAILFGLTWKGDTE